jgi:hypothetical protein
MTSMFGLASTIRKTSVRLQRKTRENETTQHALIRLRFCFCFCALFVRTLNAPCSLHGRKRNFYSAAHNLKVLSYDADTTYLQSGENGGGGGGGGVEVGPVGGGGGGGGGAVGQAALGQVSAVEGRWCGHV